MKYDSETYLKQKIQWPFKSLVSILILASSMLVVSLAQAEEMITRKNDIASESSHLPALPRSNQHIYDQDDSAVFFTIHRTAILPNEVNVSHFNLNFDNASKSYFDLDLQTRALQAGMTSFWIDYSVGFISTKGSVYDQTHQTTLDAELSTFVALPIRLGLKWRLDYFKYVNPFLGFQGTEYLYRISSSMNSAEQSGDFIGFGPLAGIQFIIPGNSNISLLAEAMSQKTSRGPQSDSSGTDYLAGAGWIF